MALSYNQDQKMRKFQEENFTEEQIDNMGFDIDKEVKGISYSWIFTLDNKEYTQKYDFKTKEITLTNRKLSKRT